MLLERAMARQAESSLSQRRELDASQCRPSGRYVRDVSIHQAPRGGRGRVVALVHERLALYRDARNTLDAHRSGRSDEREEAGHGYHPHRGGCYDSGEDPSLSPDLPGPQAFDQHILNASFPTRY